MSFKDSRELGFEECKELISKALTVMLPKESCRDFPCGPVIKTLCFHCRGNGFAPWSGNYDDKCQVSWQNIFKNIINLMLGKKKKKNNTLHYKGRTGQMDEANSRPIFEARSFLPYVYVRCI